jgi:hypothetical protein
MSTKKFTGKIEDVPMIGEFVVNNAERDINDFNGYSAKFTVDYLATVKSKVEVCKELAKSSTITKELKSATHQLYSTTKNFRIKLNALEGYLKLGANNLDIAVEDFGLKKVRSNITRSNIEGFLSSMRTSLVAVKRNQPALEAQGMKPAFIDEIETHLREINLLNVRQNELISKRNRLTSDNMDKFNDLWSNLKLIMNTAKAIYQGVNEVKLKDYTIAQLKRRVNAEKSDGKTR